VKFHPVERFDDSFPALQCWQDLREWLLVFLVDDRNGLREEVLPELRRRRHELNFVIKALCNKFKVSSTVPLQVLLLRHGGEGEPAAEAAAEEAGGKGPADLVAEFITGLQEISTTADEESLQHVVDFDDGEQICASIVNKVRSILKREQMSMEDLV